MTKARKAPLKKTQKKKIPWVNIIVLVIGALVALSMIVAGLTNFSGSPGTPSQYVTPSAVPQPTVVVSTPAP